MSDDNTTAALELAQQRLTWADSELSCPIEQWDDPVQLADELRASVRELMDLVPVPATPEVGGDNTEALMISGMRRHSTGEVRHMPGNGIGMSGTTTAGFLRELDEWMAAHDAELTEKITANLATTLRTKVHATIIAWEENGGNIERMFQRDVIDEALAAIRTLSTTPERSN
jgi:hypothetical protein